MKNLTRVAQICAYILTTAAALAKPAFGVDAVPVNPQTNPSPTSEILNPGVVSWVHFGDLHITTADQNNYSDFKTIISHVNKYLKNGVNFALLPGDNANDDTQSEYELIKQATDTLQVPLYAIPGDHDHKSGLALYNKYLEAADYYSFTADQYHFVFLDVMSGISDAERTWLTGDLDKASGLGLKSVIFMHTYDVASQLKDVIQRDHVILVDTGHTHYNEIANDGQTIFAATRSTGQATEGPVGFSLINLDNGVISWKFKPIGSWPFAMITSPSDKLLMINAAQTVKGTIDIRAKIWDDKDVTTASMQVDGGLAVAMAHIGSSQMWSVPFDSSKLIDGDHKITVNVTDAVGNSTEDTITVTSSQGPVIQTAPRSFGVMGNSVGVYGEKGLLGNHKAKAKGWRAWWPFTYLTGAN